MTGFRTTLGRSTRTPRRTRRSPTAALGLSLTLLATAAVAAEPPIVALDALRPSSLHAQATERVVELMQRHHYRIVALDDDLSAKIFRRYLDALDPERLFFLATDIAEFEPLRQRLDDVLRAAEVEPVFQVFKRLRERVAERARFARDRAAAGFDFTREESYRLRRDSEPYATTRADLDAVWAGRVKNDALELRLTGRDDAQIAETLDRRYARMARRIEQLDANDVYEIFVNAYATTVDPHSAYLSPRDSENFRIQMSLSLEGIGAALQTEGEDTVIRRIIPGGPAAASQQLRTDDRIIGVAQGADGPFVDVVSWRLADVVDLIRGPKGSVVRLQVIGADSEPGSPPRTVSLVRDTIDLEDQAARSATTEISVGDRALRIGIIDLPTFYLDTDARARGAQTYRSSTRDVARLLGELASAGVDGVLIDLRGNGGGSLIEATELTGLFIDHGPVVQIKDSRGRLDVTEDDDRGVAYAGPLAVLVDRSSASASEIFAAAIQDYGRGVVLGEHTFGKGTVQSVVPLDRAARLGQMKFTVATFFRVNGDATQLRGVVPDILFPTEKSAREEGERSLDNALPWERVAPSRFSAWAAPSTLYETLRERHLGRVGANPLFNTLIEELETRRAMRGREVVSLVEAERVGQAEQRSTEREFRDDLLRKAFGATVDDDAGEKVPDIVLDEAARVLGDLIVLGVPPRRSAGGLAAASGLLGERPLGR
ncbi:MAG: carboxy terminal-processing peptidase [Chromatiales bacterium]|nr:carboxy terminal-processing peptidase [Chromatiales bacterium]